MTEKNDLLAEYSDEPKEAESYMVCDIGGGTVDITAHLKDGEDNIEVIIPPMGNESGGKKVNEHFANFLGRIVNDPEFSLFVQIKGKRTFHKAILASIVFHDFEDVKQDFGHEATNTSDTKFLNLILNDKFLHFYKEQLIQGVQDLHDSQVTFDEDTSTLSIHYTRVKELFQPVMEGVIECTLAGLQKIKGKVDVIYLVGGFGGCSYTYSMLKPAIQSRYPNISLVVPKCHELAVSQGAVLYRRTPEKIRARRMDATYGISCTLPFKEGIHEECYAFNDPDDQQKRCDNVFFVFVTKGEKVAITDRFVGTLSPHSQKDIISTFAFYSTNHDNIQYTTDRSMKKIGSLPLEIPNPKNLPKHQREMEVSIDFSGTEIKAQARATYLPDSTPKIVVLDFL